MNISLYFCKRLSYPLRASSLNAGLQIRRRRSCINLSLVVCVEINGVSCEYHCALVHFDFWPWTICTPSRDFLGILSSARLLVIFGHNCDSTDACHLV